MVGPEISLKSSSSLSRSSGDFLRAVGDAAASSDADAIVNEGNVVGRGRHR